MIRSCYHYGTGKPEQDYHYRLRCPLDLPQRIGKSRHGKVWEVTAGTGGSTADPAADLPVSSVVIYNPAFLTTFVCL